MLPKYISVLLISIFAITLALITVSIYLSDRNLVASHSEFYKEEIVGAKKGNIIAVDAGLTNNKNYNDFRPPKLISPPIPSPKAPSNPFPPSEYWSIKSVSSMKETKDRICGQRDSAFIEQWVDRAKELGVNFIAVETPYDDPPCASSLAYTKTWVEVIRSRGLNVWHRHMPLAFEGIYNVPKNNSIDYLNQISSYIRNNPSFFVAGDIFTPTPEPQNGGIAGITYCSENVCQFSGATHFNKWLRDAIFVSKDAFSSIGLGDKVKIGYYGFDGFVAWGHKNPDWNGILEDETVKVMGNITIDHYPELVGSTMADDLDELEKRYPGVPIIIGEWGTVTGGDVVQIARNSMQAAKRPSVVGFNYWHLGVSGNEALINEDFSKREQFDEVKNFFVR
jgi:hypothetical protein